MWTNRMYHGYNEQPNIQYFNGYRYPDELYFGNEEPAIEFKKEDDNYALRLKLELRKLRNAYKTNKSEIKSIPKGEAWRERYEPALEQLAELQDDQNVILNKEYAIIREFFKMGRENELTERQRNFLSNELRHNLNF